MQKIAITALLLTIFSLVINSVIAQLNTAIG